MAENWENPVTLALEGPEKYTIISNTTEASWAMIEDWPLEDSALLTRALDTCAAVIEGKQSVEAARQAFIDAAREAGILIKE
ncbi:MULTISPECIES: DUF982 domain-containing protein [unclassified Ensifer]|uniref:DUF982 domain-containing protein n=1 Tax=unclassified Ensifer TaxID=2633371 RepID=UPI0008134FC3|nr:MULTISPECIES: DUF982 domain-containing protein [unclassified Ensifer]OCP24230.1 hypothetical protein BC363_23475 [Ensifer sp. LC384]OCP25660.1 hypothetical protein BC361_17225 [Ensifer sp. LC54]